MAPLLLVRPSAFFNPVSGHRLALLRAISDNGHRCNGRAAYIVQVTIWARKESTNEVDAGVFYQ